MDEVVAQLELPEGKRFEALRRRCREALEAEGVLGEIDQGMRQLLAEGGDQIERVVEALTAAGGQSG